MIEIAKKLWASAVAYVALLAGAGLSVAGNVEDTFRVRGVHTDGLDVIMAAAWPILVLLTIELFVSRLWSTSWGFQALRWVGCLIIGIMAMVVSWVHLHDLLASRGQLVIVTVVGPLAIDGMAIMATGLILSTRTAVANADLLATLQYARPIGPMPAVAWTGPVASVQDVAESEAAFRGEGIPAYRGVADEARTWLDSLEASVLETGHTPAAPVPVSGPPALARSNEVKPESIPRLARLEILAGADQGDPAGAVIATLAEAHRVSTRTARRWRDAALKG